MQLYHIQRSKKTSGGGCSYPALCIRFSREPPSKQSTNVSIFLSPYFKSLKPVFCHFHLHLILFQGLEESIGVVLCRIGVYMGFYLEYGMLYTCGVLARQTSCLPQHRIPYSLVPRFLHNSTPGSFVSEPPIPDTCCIAVPTLRPLTPMHAVTCRSAFVGTDST